MLYDDICSKCHKLIDQPVMIRCHNGSVHRGVLTKVDGQYAYIRPMDGAGADGPGLFVWGWGWGFPVALASIVAIAAIALFW
ncbi:hypothetical protein OYT88_09645 [Sporolactobacillus sp. CQH2019]|uniref:hypothetical protein n=1 Tax=Sporolactobacillus sp. CQH2019 TaxID=3023512 RepID=UPI0023674A6A|nr:hypothetical protein [Sporolactobacillus sp. CQH2019]MDD9148812.1 hypothetical protein [Sporolactobacillus sp. CQH2019]